MAGAKPAALSREPTVERGVSVDLQAGEKFPIEQRRQPPQPFRRQRIDALLGPPGNLKRVDEAIRQIESDGISLRLNPLPASIVDHAPELAEAPAQFPAWIVRNVPQKLAKLAPGHGTRRERQIGEERPHLARGREHHLNAVPADRHRSE